MKPAASRTFELDVRPYLQQKMEPFQMIMDQVRSLEIDDIFVLHATIKPTPLLGIMKLKGYAHKTEQIDLQHWKVTFVNKKNKKWLDSPEDWTAKMAEEAPECKETAAADKRTIELDNRGLEPPQPMIRTLSALEACGLGDEVIIHNDRVPAFLIEELNALGYVYKIEEQPDGSARVAIQKVKR